MLYSDYYNMCATHVFSLIMNILFCSSFKPSSGIYRYHKLVHVLHVYENWGLHVRGSFWRCFFLNCDGWFYKHMYITITCKEYQKIVNSCFSMRLIFTKKCLILSFKFDEFNHKQVQHIYVQSPLHWQNFSQKFWDMIQGQFSSHRSPGWSHGW